MGYVPQRRGQPYEQPARRCQLALGSSSELFEEIGEDGKNRAEFDASLNLSIPLTQDNLA